ncbi:MAG: hypothetical protein ACM3L6_02590 [Deltaproteobacteria bacterium]
MIRGAWGIVLLSAVFMAGCAEMCTFGRSSQGAGLTCERVFSKAERGMTLQQVQKELGDPQSRSEDVSYLGTVYDEVWVYGTTPPTVLYFKNGILKDKEYGEYPESAGP